MNISKFNNIPEKPFHSSTYADIANRGLIGSTNAQTFGQRNHVDQNRTSVRKYRDSYIGQGALRHQARIATDSPPGRDSAYKPPVSQSQSPGHSVIKPIGRPVTPPPPRSSFKEPPTRGFNPYS